MSSCKKKIYVGNNKLFLEIFTDSFLYQLLSCRMEFRNVKHILKNLCKRDHFNQIQHQVLFSSLSDINFFEDILVRISENLYFFIYFAQC